MTLFPEDWENYILLVSIRNRFGVQSWLLYLTTQEALMEAYTAEYSGAAALRANIMEMGVQILSSESYEQLENLWPAGRKLGD